VTLQRLKFRECGGGRNLDLAVMPPRPFDDLLGAELGKIPRRLAIKHGRG
jgi:hypothetical protein